MALTLPENAGKNPVAPVMSREEVLWIDFMRASLVGGKAYNDALDTADCALLAHAVRFNPLQHENATKPGLSLLVAMRFYDREVLLNKRVVIETKEKWARGRIKDFSGSGASAGGLLVGPCAMIRIEHDDEESIPDDEKIHEWVPLEHVRMAGVLPFK